MTARKRQSPIKKFFFRVGRVIKLTLLSLVGLVLIGAAIWLLLPHLLGIDQTKNYIFIQSDRAESVRSIYLVSFQPLENEISFQSLSLDLEAELYLNQESQTKTLSTWWQSYLQDLDSRRQTAIFGWLINHKVDRVVNVPEEVSLEASSDLTSVLRHMFLSQRTEWDQRKELLSLYAYAKDAEFIEQEGVEQVLNIKLPIIDEGRCSLALINTTQISGLAGRMGHIAEQMGVRVIRIGSNDLDLDRTKLVVKDLNKCEIVLDSMQQVLLSQAERVEDQAQMTQLLSRFRADFVVLLGKDQSLAD